MPPMSLDGARARFPRASLLWRSCGRGEWRREHPEVECRLALHVVDQSVSREISSGRIDIVELLHAESIRFWAEIVENGVLLDRRLFQEDELTRLQTIVDDLGLPTRYWTFLVSPPSGITENPDPVALDMAEAGHTPTSRSLRELGVVPGSVLHFHRRPPIAR